MWILRTNFALVFIDLKSAEPTPSSWSLTRPSTKMQRQASGTSMNRLPILPICLPHLSATSCSPRCSHFATRSDSMRKPVARSFWLKPACRIVLRDPPPDPTLSTMPEERADNRVCTLLDARVSKGADGGTQALDGLVPNVEGVVKACSKALPSALKFSQPVAELLARKQQFSLGGTTAKKHLSSKPRNRAACLRAF